MLIPTESAKGNIPFPTFLIGFCVQQKWTTKKFKKNNILYLQTYLQAHIYTTSSSTASDLSNTLLYPTLIYSIYYCTTCDGNVFISLSTVMYWVTVHALHYYQDIK